MHPLRPEFTAKGHPKRGGRKKGTRNKRTIVQAVLLGKGETLELLAKGDGKKLKPRQDRIADLLTCGNRQVQATMERALLDHDWGKAKETIELGGSVELSQIVVAARDRAKSRG